MSENTSLRIGFLSQFAPDDRKASSGTAYKMAEQLARLGQLIWIPIQLSATGRNLARIESHGNRIMPRRLMVRMTTFGSRHSYKSLQTRLIESCDVIAAFFCSDVLSYLKTDKPIIYFTDATFPAMLDYYPDFSNLWHFNRTQGIRIERQAIANVAATVFSSDWARESAISELNGAVERLHTVEFGPNIDIDNIHTHIREYNGTLNLLFLGVNWQRKGGDIAVAAAKYINEHGINCQLNLVGVNDVPDYINSLPYVHNIGFLNKNNPDEYDRLCQIIDNSDILILPTLNECSAVAFAEASAYGLPIITHDTGGIPNYVINDYNGYRLPIGSTGDDFGYKIIGIINNGDLTRLSNNAISLFKEKLNYDIWLRKVSEIVSSII